jgi:putative SOS response-associated peptidase YedK
VSSRSPVNRLVPSWAKDPKIGNRMINARAETVHEKPAFRRAFKSRRMLLPVDGFYEWFRPSRSASPASR